MAANDRRRAFRSCTFAWSMVDLRRDRVAPGANEDAALDGMTRSVFVT
jgi:hypothetical protein